MQGVRTNLVQIDSVGNIPKPYTFGEEYIIFPKYFYRNKYEGFRWLNKVEYSGKFSYRFYPSFYVFKIYFSNIKTKEEQIINISTNFFGMLKIKYWNNLLFIQRKFWETATTIIALFSLIFGILN